jgi:hypothetical protein
MAWFPDTTEAERATEITPSLAPMLPNEWREEEVAQLLALRADGLTCVKVAERMGKTKGMIVGKLDRLRKSGAHIPVGVERAPATPLEVEAIAAERSTMQLALPSPAMLGRCPRDENGWRVPNDGTVSRQVYDLLKAGATFDEIAVTCGDRSKARGYVFNIQNPDHKPQRTRYEAREAKRRALQSPATVTPDVIYLPGPTVRVVVYRQRISVVKVSLDEDRAHFVGNFNEPRDANACAIQSDKPHGVTYMVYEQGRRRICVSWEPLSDERWYLVQRIADRDVHVI